MLFHTEWNASVIRRKSLRNYYNNSVNALFFLARGYCYCVYFIIFFFLLHFSCKKKFFFAPSISQQAFLTLRRASIFGTLAFRYTHFRCDILSDSLQARYSSARQSVWRTDLFVCGSIFSNILVCLRITFHKNAVCELCCAVCAPQKKCVPVLNQFSPKAWGEFIFCQDSSFECTSC